MRETQTDMQPGGQTPDYDAVFYERTALSRTRRLLEERGAG